MNKGSRPGSSPCILIGEADDDTCAIIRAVMDRAGIVNPIRAVGTFAAVLAYLQGKGAYRDRVRFPAPALILLGAELPDAPAREILAWLIKNHNRRFGVVLLVGATDLKELQASIKWGLDSFLLKPYDLHRVLDVAQAHTALALQRSEAGRAVVFVG